MIEFKITKKSKKSNARLGVLKTPHGVIKTPAFVPVATQATIKALTNDQVEKTNSQIFISNTFHLHFKPGEKIIKSTGGIHNFSNIKKPIMTDSGGFQVFSLGFGQDLGVGKIVKFFPGKEEKSNIPSIKKGQQPKYLKITDEGVFFRSPVNGDKEFIGPKESIKIQKDIGADIMFAFDECTPPFSTRKYIEKSLERTHDWAKICIKERGKGKQALFGIVQGSNFKDLREQSAKFINSLGFDGFGIGGDLGESKSDTKKILSWTLPHLDESKPRHLLGIGHIEDMEPIIKSGVDTFDCIVPTHYARRGIAFVCAGRLNLGQTKFLKDKKPLDSKCGCMVCKNYKRSYISHLVRAKEIAGMSLITLHNLYFFNAYVEKIRQKIKEGKILFFFLVVL
ncbi:MAG: tRNA guanosine(34) transglycosylase Tgt [Candidatus Marinimicrobia bacterium]|nr:tRNA guanosine(34) transglycosylase Tgt [Candidatus Neomarinimicrobiota bacterium]